MDSGSYNTKPLNFNSFGVSKFNPWIFDKKRYGEVGCGACLIATLTGESPYKIKERNKNKKSIKYKNDPNHYSESFVINELKKHQIKVKKITKASLTNYKNDYLIENIDKNNHVLITNQLVKRGESSWFLYFSDTCYHNFSQYSIRPLDFVNFPIISVHLAWKKEWA